LSNALAGTITLVCQFQHDLLGLNFGDTQDFDGEFHIFQKNMQGQIVYVLNPFLSIMVFVQLTKSSQHVGYDVRPLLQGALIHYSIC
jgi:hypothetical protein